MATTPYDHMTAGHHDRADELGEVTLLAKERRKWSWFLASLLALSVMGNIGQGLQKTVTARWVEVDKASMTQRVLTPPAEAYEPAESIVRWVLSQMVIDLRSVPTDPALLEQRWEHLRRCTTKNGAALLKKYELKEHPTEQRLPRKVEIAHIRKKTPRSYDIRWVEWQYDKDKVLKKTETFSGMLSFERLTPTTEEALQGCLAGIMLEDWDRGKDL
jgi:type IV secretory pathway TrbF-like protein